GRLVMRRGCDPGGEPRSLGRGCLPGGEPRSLGRGCLPGTGEPTQGVVSIHSPISAQPRHLPHPPPLSSSYCHPPPSGHLPSRR
ncbi:hypothetical protein EV363DRAFT_1187159, partial [Boletus edulis]